MSAPEEGVEQLDVRTCWPHEALDFTPWLAEQENLDLLGAELGLRLECAQTEVPVGSLYLDILAREAETGALVAIENQLEETDLGHLGQLLTYATGCDARVAIWVAPGFYHEYAQALHKLNQWTGDDVRFYGVKIELVRKAGGDPEPRFRTVVRPGEWRRDRTLAPGAKSARAQQHDDFFQPLIGDLRRVRFTGRDTQYFDHTGRWFPSQVGDGIGYAVSFWKNAAWVTLHIRMGDNEVTKHIFDELLADRERIESSSIVPPRFRMGVGQERPLHVLLHQRLEGRLHRRSAQRSGEHPRVDVRPAPQVPARLRPGRRADPRRGVARARRLIGGAVEYEGGGVMIRPVAVEAREGRRIWLRYSDGAAGEVDLAQLSGRGVFAAWDKPGCFEQVHIAPHRAIAWSDDLELCPDALYMELTGKTLEQLPADGEAPVGDG